MQIPFSPPYIDQDIIDEVTDTLKSGWITTGPKAKLLEEEIAAFCNVENALTVSSATSAMMLALHWFGVTRGDEVIIPAYTYCATALAVMHIGATPVMVDVCEDFNIDPEKIKQAITAKTKAVISVDFSGWPCNYDAINDLLEDETIKQKFTPSNQKQQALGRILLLSDAAHALGAVYNNMPVSKCADITVFSLHAVKNVTSAEGGIICLNMRLPFNNLEIYNTLRLYEKYHSLDQAIDRSLQAKQNGEAVSIAYIGNAITMLKRLIQRNITPDTLTDQTSAHDELVGYFPES
ncbi:MAG TPA: aminotransferase class I/II-fold pyridoxal phosphate-dependent enzyme, partial [Panacibacter sp.]|nr:aminotransferase class I/II-fold pyridoxal phosphate-dependent enzyme [Panacibacter sp.]